MKRLPLFKPEPGAPTYWRSLAHLADKPEVADLVEREFNDGASVLDSTSRRSFLTVMSASFAAMGLAGCVRRPEEKIIPYQKMPENLIPGIPQFYATAVCDQGEAVGLLVECHEGRPTKIEGNPDHPASLGGTSPALQALPLDLYDPDRLSTPVQMGAGRAVAEHHDEALPGLDSHGVDPRVPSKALLLPDHLPDVKAVRLSWDEALGELSKRLDGLAARQGAGLRVLVEPCASPTATRLKNALLARFPQARIAEYSSTGSASQRAGLRLATGADARLDVAYDKARVIVAVDSDFLHTEPGSIVASKRFSRGRRIRKASDNLTRLYVAEPAFTVTGMNADHRLIVPASQAEDFLAALGVELGKKGVALGALGGKLRPTAAVDAKFVTALANDLVKNRGASAIVVGARQSAAAHALALALNDALGNTGKTVVLRRPADAAVANTIDLKTLVDDLNKGQIDTLLILGGNPVYAAPGDLNIAAALDKAASRFYLTSHLDETALALAAKGGWALPMAHPLEAWGDLRSFDGQISVQQPLIAPMFDGRSVIELLALAAKTPERKGYDLVQATFRGMGLGATANEAQTTDAQGSAGAHGEHAPAAASAMPAGSASAGTIASATPASSAGPGIEPGKIDPTVHGPAPGAAPGVASAVVSAVPLAAAAPSGSAPAMAASAAPTPPGPLPSAVSKTVSDRAWKRALHDGIVRGTAVAPAGDLRVNVDAVAAALGKAPAAGLGAQSLEVTFSPDPGLGDGRFSNVAWLQELPNPVTKMVWDNAAWIAPKLADELGVKSGDVVKLVVEGRSVEIPVWVVPGTHPYSVQVHLGWGRKMLGRIASPEVGPSRQRGFHVGALRSSASMGFAVAAKIDKGGTSLNEYPLVVTQEHNMVDDGMSKRPIVHETTLEEYRKNPKVIEERQIEHPALIPLWPERRYEGYKWGMAIDLTACTGCSTCVIACQAENNIPTVGKEQVARQREMHWLRIDRYFSGTPENPSVISQPMACVHCENAPCENVCPVNATSHSPEGLNEMTYNRCIGTRYCANNCPYKARRFNFLDFHETVPETVKMSANPNVSVRMRGVMEKCTYCVQRIQSVKIATKREGYRKIHDGEIRTACQQACPSDAIVFGDLNDPHSLVSQLSSEEEVKHGFRVLEELNTKPRTTYLAKIRNPNPELA